MSRKILVTCLCLATLAGAGCTRVVRDTQTIVERPTVTRETVVEKPAVTRETIVAAPASCSLGNEIYSTGSLSCQSGFQHRCNNGIWERVPGSYPC